jgi:acyl-coenzyme A thioesterase PaaI-like protein
LHLTGAQARGRIEAQGWFEGMIEGTRGRQALARFVLRDGERMLGFGGGSFMVLDPPPGVALHPTPLRHRDDPLPVALTADDLQPDEQALYARASQALTSVPVSGDAATAPASFIDAFWGAHTERGDGEARCVMDNAGHVGNRVGHMQGGLLMDYLTRCAEAALPDEPAWTLTAASVGFVSPGAGDRLHASAQVVHRGGLTAVVRTEVRREDGRLVMDGVTHHSRCADTRG